MTQQVSLSRLSMFYGDLDASLLLHAMIHEEFAGEIALISSFGADAALMLSLVADVDPATPVLFLETQKHFPETLEYARTLTTYLGLKNVHWLTPDPEMTARIDPKGDLWSTQPNRCCWLRKVEPLNRAVEQLGIKALITGRKRYQTSLIVLKCRPSSSMSMAFSASIRLRFGIRSGQKQEMASA